METIVSKTTQPQATTERDRKNLSTKAFSVPPFRAEGMSQDSQFRTGGNEANKFATQFKIDRNEQFFMTNHALFFGHIEADCKTSEQRVLGILQVLQNHGEGKVSWPSYRYMSDKLGLHRQTVIRSVRRLEKKGLISVERRRVSKRYHTSNRYRINDTVEKIRHAKYALAKSQMVAEGEEGEMEKIEPSAENPNRFSGVRSRSENISYPNQSRPSTVGWGAGFIREAKGMISKTKLAFSKVMTGLGKEKMISNIKKAVSGWLPAQTKHSIVVDGGNDSKLSAQGWVGETSPPIAGLSLKITGMMMLFWHAFMSMTPALALSGFLPAGMMATPSKPARPSKPTCQSKKCSCKRRNDQASPIRTSEKVKPDRVATRLVKRVKAENGQTIDYYEEYQKAEREGKKPSIKAPPKLMEVDRFIHHYENGEPRPEPLYVEARIFFGRYHPEWQSSQTLMPIDWRRKCIEWDARNRVRYRTRREWHEANFGRRGKRASKRDPSQTPHLNERIFVAFFREWTGKKKAIHQHYLRRTMEREIYEEIIAKKKGAMEGGWKKYTLSRIERMEEQIRQGQI